MKLSNALSILQVTASMMAMPIEHANGIVVVNLCNYNQKCSIICSDEYKPATGPTDGSRMNPAVVIIAKREVTTLSSSTDVGMCGIDWNPSGEWAEDIGDVAGYEIDSALVCGDTTESFVKREIDVGAHADWKDEVDAGAHVEWNNKADTKEDI